jgi:tRNA U55 pseudouridine synthase TruB
MNVISPEELSRGLLEKTGNTQNIESKTQLGAGLALSGLSGVIPIYKEWGDTPLETLGKLQKKYPVLENTPLSYAGRLDPLAEGLMLVLVGDTNKDREVYLHLNKTYEVEVLLGVKTDTGDLFGIPIGVSLNPLGGNISDGDEAGIKKLSRIQIEPFTESVIESAIGSFIGKQQFSYPAYSSKTVAGKPLFQWMNEGRISEIEIPKKDVEIYSLKVVKDVELNSVKHVKAVEVMQKIEKALANVRGDFRYTEIRDGWTKILSGGMEEDFPIIKIECSCSSGTYMRVLAEEIGKKIGVPALAYSIKRTKVGDVGLDAVTI